MRIKILSYSEHERVRDSEPSMQQDKSRYGYRRWSAERKALLQQLAKHGIVDPNELGDGDFFVGADWFETGVFHVAINNWEILTNDFLRECYDFLRSPGRSDFIIIIVKSMPQVEEMFELVISSKHSYFRLFERTASASNDILRRDERYAGIKKLVS